jgi:hypothetical protein
MTTSRQVASDLEARSSSARRLWGVEFAIGSLHRRPSLEVAPSRRCPKRRSCGAAFCGEARLATVNPAPHAVSIPSMRSVLQQQGIGGHRLRRAQLLKEAVQVGLPPLFYDLATDDAKDGHLLDGHLPVRRSYPGKSATVGTG